MQSEKFEICIGVLTNNKHEIFQCRDSFYMAFWVLTVCGATEGYRNVCTTVLTRYSG
jgi:hypothetical protein